MEDQCVPLILVLMQISRNRRQSFSIVEVIYQMLKGSIWVIDLMLHSIVHMLEVSILGVGVCVCVCVGV